MVNVVSVDGLANATKGKIGHVKEEVLYTATSTAANGANSLIRGG